MDKNEWSIYNNEEYYCMCSSCGTIHVSRLDRDSDSMISMKACPKCSSTLVSKIRRITRFGNEFDY
jgi:DNA-directed RNA polymerase subunit RPC12/RpoP